MRPPWLASADVGAAALAAPGGLIEAVAGVALVATFGAALHGEFAVRDHLVAAATTLLVTLSGVQIASVGPEFWGLASGIAILLLVRPRAAPPSRHVTDQGLGVAGNGPSRLASEAGRP